MTQPIDAIGFLGSPIGGIPSAFARKKLSGRPRVVSIGDSILCNASYQSTTPTSLTASGTTITVNLTAHGYQPGTRIYTCRYDQAEYNGCYRVASVIDANNFTYVVPVAPTVSPATSANFPTSSKVYTLDKKSNRDIGGLACAMLRQCAIEAINLAVSGERTDETLARMDSLILQQLADIYLIHDGYNDVQQGDYGKLMNALSAAFAGTSFRGQAMAQHAAGP